MRALAFEKKGASSRTSGHYCFGLARNGALIGTVMNFGCSKRWRSSGRGALAALRSDKKSRRGRRGSSDRCSNVHDHLSAGRREVKVESDEARSDSALCGWDSGHTEVRPSKNRPARNPPSHPPGKLSPACTPIAVPATSSPPTRGFRSQPDWPCPRVFPATLGTASNSSLRAACRRHTR